jgi:hypothetical protein
MAIPMSLACVVHSERANPKDNSTLDLSVSLLSMELAVGFEITHVDYTPFRACDQIYLVDGDDHEQVLLLLLLEHLLQIALVLTCRS